MKIDVSPGAANVLQTFLKCATVLVLLGGWPNFRKATVVNQTVVRSGRKEFFDENTLRKVYSALESQAITGEVATNVVNSIQNEGILFRERKS